MGDWWRKRGALYKKEVFSRTVRLQILVETAYITK